MRYSKTIVPWVVLTLAPNLLHAYVGPGVGLSALGSILAFIGAIFLLIAGFLWYPIKRLIKGRAAKKPSPHQSSSQQAGDSTQARGAGVPDDGDP